MLRNLIFMLSFVVGSFAFAQSTQVRTCINALQYYYLAPYGQALSICNQNSSNEFLSCMERKAETTNLDITDVVPMCSRKVRTTPRFNTCEAKLQKDARMGYDLSIRTCQWDPSPMMQSCIIEISQQARFHPEHALQYCAFAKSQYPHQMNYFKSCVIMNANRGYDVYGAVQNCHDRITGVFVEPVLPPVEDRRPTPVYPQYPQPQPQPQVEPQPQQPSVQPEAVKPPQNKTGTVTKVPAPVEIKVQESSKPKVEDQELESQSTSNAESLPL